MQANAECSQNEGEESSTNQNTEMSSSAEHQSPDLKPSPVTGQSNGNDSVTHDATHSASHEDTEAEKTVKNSSKVTFNEINLHHNVVNQEYSQRPKNKVLKRKNTPASLPKVAKMNGRSNVTK